jgi:cyclophilin family peptidyl-prolyl cis-trans isomerase
MRSFVTSILLALLFVPGCDGQSDRSASAREALAAVDQFRAFIEELETLAPRAKEIEDSMIVGEPADPKAPRMPDRPNVELAALTERMNQIRDKAQQSFRTLKPDLDGRLARDPKDPGLLEARSRLRETLGNLDETPGHIDAALADLDAARAILPKDVALRARRPGLLRRLGKYEEARSACAELLKEEPGHPVALATDGLCLYAMNSFPDAVARLGEAAAKEGRLEASLLREVKRTLDAAKTKQAEWDEEQKKRAAEAKADNLPRVKIVTSKGDVVVELFENEAPNAVANFIDLCDRKFFDGTKFHRVISDFMVQGGDPNSKDANPNNDGQGGPGYTFRDEFEPGYRRHFRGVLSLANHGKDTNGSQFFITHRPTEALDGKHVVFGRVIEGMSVVDTILKGDAIVGTEIIRRRPHAYRPVVE